jgi:hypothetical protein
VQAKGAGGDGETIGNADSVGSKLADELPERGVLAADLRDGVEVELAKGMT